MRFAILSDEAVWADQCLRIVVVLCLWIHLRQADDYVGLMPASYLGVSFSRRSWYRFDVRADLFPRSETVAHLIHLRQHDQFRPAAGCLDRQLELGSFVLLLHVKRRVVLDRRCPVPRELLLGRENSPGVFCRLRSPLR